MGSRPRSSWGCPRATIDDVCAPGGTVLLLAPDIKEELPVLFLRLRHAVVRDGVTVIELASRRTPMSELAAATLLHRPGAAGEVARALLSGSSTQEVGGVDPADIEAAAGLLAGGAVTVVLGRSNLAESADGIVAAASAIHVTHPEVRFLSALRRANVHGALDMGLAPGLLPGRTTLASGAAWFRGRGWGRVPTTRGLDSTGILEAAAAGKIDVLVLLGADPLADFPDSDLASRAIAGARAVIAVDRFLTPSAQQADIVLAAAGPSEVDGTTTNIEGRVSTVTQKITPPGTARDDWMLAAELSRLLGTDLGLTSPRQILEEIATVAPTHAGITPAALEGGAGHDGLLVGAPDETSDPEGSGTTSPALVGFDVSVTSEAPAVDAYSLRLVATRKLYDLGTDVQHAPGLAGLTSDTVLRLHPHDFDRLGVDPGAVVTVTASTGSATLPVVPDASVGRGAAAVVLHQPGPQVRSLIDATATVTEVRVVKA